MGVQFGGLRGAAGAWVHGWTEWLRGRVARAGGWAWGGALTYAVLHIVGMYGLRALVYTQAGVPYDSGPWQHVLLYETAKDAVSYATLALISRGIWTAQRAAAMERELAAARLARLADQVQPHFLFNTLNLVSSVMYEGTWPRRTACCANWLTCCVRRWRRSSAASNTVGEELALIEPFLALMQSRFGEERLKVEIDADATARACRLPALLLLAPVENAIKHDVARHQGQVAVRVSAERREAALRIEVVSECLGPLEPEPLPTSPVVASVSATCASDCTRVTAPRRAARLRAMAQGARLQLELPIA